MLAHQRIFAVSAYLHGIIEKIKKFSQEECLAEQKRAPHFRLGPETAILPVSAYLHGIMDTAFHYSRRLWKRLCPCVCRSKRPILG